MSHPAVSFRRALHQIPELDRDLPETLAFVRSVLDPLCCKVFSPAPSSLCAWFDAGRPETAAFRCDMDALPVTERPAVPYCSRHPGNMHACGHDGHTAMVLALAQRIPDLLPRLPRNVLLIFQPAEETNGGALAICESGVLEEYRVSRIFGFHLWPGLPAGTVWTRPGPLMAKNSEIDVLVEGRSAHITKSSQGVDALLAGAEALRRITAMADRELPQEELRVVKFGHMTSGTIRNAISSRTVLEGSVRVFSMDTFRLIQRRCREILEELDREWGTASSVRFSAGYPPVHNDPGLLQALTAALGGDAPGLLDRPELTAEDFSFYQQRVPGVFFFLGAGDVPPLHAADFDFDDEAVLPAGAAFYEKLLLLP